MTPFSDRSEIEQFRTLLARRFGLQYEDAKLDYLAEVARRRMELTGIASLKSYLERLSSSSRGAEEYRTLSEQLTVNETFFFRNADSFRAFAGIVLPERIRARAREKRLRILSAGCASGEEPYSLAVMVREALPDLVNWDVKITGIDVSPAILAKAAEARYSAWSLRATSEDARRRYFRADGEDFVLSPDIQRMVTFEEHNLADEDPLFWQSLDCDVVFCRNVLMYFTPDVARDVVSRIGRALVPNGFFFLGHAETLRGLTQEFRLCHTHDTFYYRRNDASGAVVAKTSEAGSPEEQSPSSLPSDVEPAASWVDVIQRASKRIAELSDSGSAATAVAGRTWDLRPVLDAMRLERFSAALQLIRELPPDSDGDPDALLLRAVLLTNNGMLDESEEVCHRLLAVDEFNAGAHYLMALCREHAGDLTAAVDQGQTAIYLDAGFAMPHFHLGVMARRSGDAATAQREFGLALSLFAREDAARLLLFGGGFSRETLLQLSRTQLRAAGGKE